MARPHRIPGEAADHVVRARVTAAELAALEGRAEASGRNMSDLVRACLGLATAPAKPRATPRAPAVSAPQAPPAAPLPSSPTEPALAPPAPAAADPPSPAVRPRFGGAAGIAQAAQVAQPRAAAQVQLQLAPSPPPAAPVLVVPLPVVDPPKAPERFRCRILGELELPGFEADGTPRSTWKGGAGFFEQTAIDAAPPGRVRRIAG